MDSLETIITRATELHSRFAAQERADTPMIELADLAMMMMILTARKYPVFERITQDHDVLGYIRNALDTAYLLGYQAGQETAEPPAVFVDVLKNPWEC